MSEPRKSTAAALRAAKEIVSYFERQLTERLRKIKHPVGVPTDAARQSLIAAVARQIDRETHLPELIEALKEADKQFRIAGWSAKVHPRAMIRAALVLVKEPPDASA